MNNQEMIREVSRVSNIEEVKSAKILKAYETYCEGQMFKGREKHQEAIIQYVHETTAIEYEEIQVVMEAFFQTAKAELKSKIPFMK